MKKFAKIISKIFDPLILGTAILLVAILSSPMSKSEMIAWFVGAAFLNGMIPLYILKYFTDKGYVFDDVLSNATVTRQRIKIFVVFIIALIIEILIMASTHLYQPLMAVFTAVLVLLVVCMVISYFWKVSIHSAIASLFVAIIILLFGLVALPLTIIIPLVMWSRIALHRHTLGQVITGFILATIILWITFELYGITSYIKIPWFK